MLAVLKGPHNRENYANRRNPLRATWDQNDIAPGRPLVTYSKTKRDHSLHFIFAVILTTNTVLTPLIIDQLVFFFSSACLMRLRPIPGTPHWSGPKD